MFLTYLIKADKREVPRLYVKHIRVLFLFLVFQENYLYVIKVDKKEVLRLYFKHIYVLWLVSDFPRKLPLCGKCE